MLSSAALLGDEVLGRGAGSTTGGPSSTTGTAVAGRGGGEGAARLFCTVGEVERMTGAVSAGVGAVSMTGSVAGAALEVGSYFVGVASRSSSLRSGGVEGAEVILDAEDVVAGEVFSFNGVGVGVGVGVDVREMTTAGSSVTGTGLSAASSSAAETWSDATACRLVESRMPGTAICGAALYVLAALGEVDAGVSLRGGVGAEGELKVGAVLSLVVG